MLPVKPPQPPLLVTFTLYLAAPADPERVVAVLPRLEALPGMFQVMAVAGLSDRLTLTYDLHQLCLEGVERFLTEAGLPPDDGFWHSQRRAWQRFTETNHLANGQHQPHCCNKAPGHQ